MKEGEAKSNQAKSRCSNVYRPKVEGKINAQVHFRLLQHTSILKRVLATTESESLKLSEVRGIVGKYMDPWITLKELISS